MENAHRKICGLCRRKAQLDTKSNQEQNLTEKKIELLADDVKVSLRKLVLSN